MDCCHAYKNRVEKSNSGKESWKAHSGEKSWGKGKFQGKYNELTVANHSGGM